MWKLSWTNHLGEQILQTFYNLGDMLEYMDPDSCAENIDYVVMINLNVIFIKE